MPTQYRCPAATTLPICSAATYPLGYFAGASNIAAALIAFGFAATSLVTIGVTNADVTSNSDVDDGATDQGMDCI